MDIPSRFSHLQALQKHEFEQDSADSRAIESKQSGARLNADPILHCSDDDFHWPWFSRCANHVRSSPAALPRDLTEDKETDKAKNTVILSGDFYTEKVDEAPALDITVPSEGEKL